MAWQYSFAYTNIYHCIRSSADRVVWYGQEAACYGKQCFIDGIRSNVEPLGRHSFDISLISYFFLNSLLVCVLTAHYSMK